MTEFEMKREMELYKKMYHLIFNAVTDVVEKTDDVLIRQALIKAQQEAEAIYING